MQLKVKPARMEILCDPFLPAQTIPADANLSIINSAPHPTLNLLASKDRQHSGNLDEPMRSQSDEHHES